MTENPSTSSDNCHSDNESVPIIASFKSCKSHCIFCAKECPPAFVIERGKLQRIKEEMELNSFGCDNVILAKQLRVINIMKNILDIRQDTCQKFLGHFDGQNHPEFWVKVCVSCKVFVEEFNTTRREISRLQKKASQLKGKLKRFILTSNQDEELEVDSAVWREIRDEVLTGFEHSPPEPLIIPDVQRQEEEQCDIQMQVEVEPEFRVKTEPLEKPRNRSRVKEQPTAKAKETTTAQNKRKKRGAGRKRKSRKTTGKSTTEENGERQVNSVELNSQTKVENISDTITTEKNGVELESLELENSSNSTEEQREIASRNQNQSQLEEMSPIIIKCWTINSTADMNRGGSEGMTHVPSSAPQSISEENNQNMSPLSSVENMPLTPPLSNEGQSENMPASPPMTGEENNEDNSDSSLLPNMEGIGDMPLTLPLKSEEKSEKMPLSPPLTSDEDNENMSHPSPTTYEDNKGILYDLPQSTSEDTIENLPEPPQSTRENIGNKYLSFLEETSHLRRLSWLRSSNSEALSDENNDVSKHTGEATSNETEKPSTPAPILEQVPMYKFRMSLKTALSFPISTSPTNIIPPWKEEDRLVRESLQSSQSLPPQNPSQVEVEIPSNLSIPPQSPQVEVETQAESPIPPTQNPPRVEREIPAELSVPPLNPPPIHVETAPIPPQNLPQVETETIDAAVSSNNSINVHGIDDFLANLLNRSTPPPPSTPARAVPVSQNNKGMIKCDKCPATLKKSTKKHHQSLHNGIGGVPCPACGIFVHKSRVAFHQRSEKCLKYQPLTPQQPVETVERNNSNPTAAKLLRRDFFYFKNGEYVPHGFTRLMGPLSAAIYQCKACPAKVKKGEVLVHEALHKSAGEEWSSVCSYCGLFIRTDELSKHEESECSKKESRKRKQEVVIIEQDENLDDDDYYKCKDCYALLKPEELKQHLQLHETGSSSRNICLYCSWLVVDMDSHKSQWHSESGLLKDNSWALGPNFWVVDGSNPNYILFKQEYVSKFQCRKCPAKFLSREQVEKHAKHCSSSTAKKRRVSASTSATNTSNGPNFGYTLWNCGKCNARCLTEQRQEHDRLHESGNGVTCDMCGLMLKAETLVPHLLYFHP